MTGADYTALDDRRVRVEGSAWIPSDNYNVKLEGARRAGFQTVSLGPRPRPALCREYPRLVRRYRGEMHRESPRPYRRQL